MDITPDYRRWPSLPTRTSAAPGPLVLALYALVQAGPQLWMTVPQVLLANAPVCSPVRPVCSVGVAGEWGWLVGRVGAHVVG